jgi:quercetin dioxygenase-like cupin family protein
VFVRARFAGRKVFRPAGHEPEHDHTHDGQEEIYTVISGSAKLQAGGAEHQLEPGVFARVGAGEKRKFVTGSEPAQILAMGGVPGAAYEAPPYTEVGAPEPSMG